MKMFFLFFVCFLVGFFDMLSALMFFLFFVCLMFFELGFFWFGGIFFCDSLSFFLLYLTVLVFMFCFFSSLIDNWMMNFYWGFLFVLSSIFFLLLLSFLSLSIFIFYICFESIFIFMFMFLLSWGYSPERLQASFYMVFYTIVVSFPFLVYLVFFGDSFLILKFVSFSFFSSYWWFFVFFVFFVKLPVYGVHLWLPKAHVEAPVSGSMVLAGVLLKLGGYGFLRFSYFVSFSLFKHSGYFVSIGLFGGLLSCFLCIRQIDLKAFVAYSSICHMGLGLAGVYSYSFYGLSGGVFMLVSHGFCSSCMFYLLYLFYERYHSRSLFILKGVGYLIPSMALIWFIFSVINMGVPPTISFFSEVSVLVGMLSMNLWNSLLGGLFLFLAGVYGIYFFVVSCHGHNLTEGKGYVISMREYLNVYGHFFPLVFIPLYLNYFFS